MWSSLDVPWLPPQDLLVVQILLNCAVRLFVHALNVMEEKGTTLISTKTFYSGKRSLDSFSSYTLAVLEPGGFSHARRSQHAWLETH